jgi:hypothetical protein
LLLVPADAVPDTAPAAAPAPVPTVPFVAPPALVVPLLLGTEAVPVVMTAPTPVVDMVWLLGTELIAVVPEVIAPGPVTVPAVAAPPTAALLVVVVVVLLMAFAGGRLGLVLVSVPAGVVAAPSGGVVVVGAAGVSVGSVTNPAPAWPAPGEPGVDPPTGSFVVAACAAAGTGAASRSNATAAMAFGPRQHPPRALAPDRDWLHLSASATVIC